VPVFGDAVSIFTFDKRSVLAAAVHAARAATLATEDRNHRSGGILFERTEVERQTETKIG